MNIWFLFYSFNKNGCAVAISFSSNDLNKSKKNKFENLLKRRKLLLNLTKSDSQFIKKNKKANSKESEIFMSLYKKMLISK